MAAGDPCEKCGGAVPAHLMDGDNCPNCGFEFPYERADNPVITDQAEFMLVVHDYEVGDSTQDVIQAAASKYTFQNTECGAWCSLYPDRVELGSVVEGLDGDGVTTTPLVYPFTLKDYDETVAYLEADAQEAFYGDSDDPDLQAFEDENGTDEDDHNPLTGNRI